MNVHIMPNTKAQPDKTELDRFHTWLATEDPISIATHVHVDADAAFSAALLCVLKPKAALVFVPADAVIEDQRTLAVDLLNGPRAVKGLKVGSAFGLLVHGLKGIDAPVYKALKRWASQLNKTDSGKGCHDPVVLAELVSAWRHSGLDDAACVQRAKELIQGKIRAARSNANQKHRAKNIQINDGVAVLTGDVRIRKGHVFARGAKVIVRESACGHCLLLSKCMLKRGLTLRTLAPLLEPHGWFVHPDGFLACYGSVKAPRDHKKSGFKLGELVLLVTTWLNSIEHAAPPQTL